MNQSSGACQWLLLTESHSVGRGPEHAEVTNPRPLVVKLPIDTFLTCGGQAISSRSCFQGMHLLSVVSAPWGFPKKFSVSLHGRPPGSLQDR